MTIKRRSLIYGLGTAPFISHFGLASSGTLSIAMYEDELAPIVKTTFEKDTGIKIKHVVCDSNAAILEQSNGVDLVAPSTTNYIDFIEANTLIPLNEAKVIKLMATLNKQILNYVIKNWNFGKGNTLLPHVWGTEGIAWNTDLWKPKGGTRVSYGDIWNPDVKGKAFGRVGTLIYSAGVYLEGAGKLPPGYVAKAYTSPNIFDNTWNAVMKFVLPKKSQFSYYWEEGGEEQKDGFTKHKCAIGQTWDNPPLSLKAAGQPIAYQAPKEGAITWIDGIAITKSAKDTEACYKFIEYLLRRDLAGKAIDDHHYNSVVVGAEQHASGNYLRNFNETFPDDATSKLHLWLAEPKWYVEKWDALVAAYNKAK